MKFYKVLFFVFLTAFSLSALASPVLLRLPDWVTDPNINVAELKDPFAAKEVGFVTADFSAWGGTYSKWEQIYAGPVIKEQQMITMDSCFLPKLKNIDNINKGLGTHIVRATYIGAETATGTSIGRDIVGETIFSLENQFENPRLAGTIGASTSTNASKPVMKGTIEWCSGVDGAMSPEVKTSYTVETVNEGVRTYKISLECVDNGVAIVGLAVFICGGEIPAGASALIAGVILAAKAAGLTMSDTTITATTVTEPPRLIGPNKRLLAIPYCTKRGPDYIMDTYFDDNCDGIADGGHYPVRTPYTFMVTTHVEFGVTVEESPKTP